MSDYEENDIKKAEKYCLRLLAVKSRSEYEILKRLEAKGYLPACGSTVVQKLKNKRYIDDKTMAEDWIDSRIKFNPRSRRLVKQELLSKGIKENIIERALDAVGEILDDRNMSVSIVKSQLENVKDLTGEKKKAKLFRILLVRGFDEDTALEAVESVIGD